MRVLNTAIIILCALLGGCENQPKQPVTTSRSEAVPAVARDQPGTAPAIEPELVELPSDALPLWRKYAERKPELVLFSMHPFLEQIPEPVKKEALRLVREGSDGEILARNSFYRPATLLLPTQAVSAAIEIGFFSAVTWVFPSKVTIDQLSLETFRKQVVEAGFLTETEGQSLSLAAGAYLGTVRGLPFRAVHPSALPVTDKPVVVHVDLSYFAGLYQDEVKTPLYDLLHSTAVSLRDAGWQPVATTLSHSTIEGAVSLDTRFVLINLAELLAKPEMLEKDMPESWQLRAQALYGAEMFQPQKKKEMHRRAARIAPDDATALYDLYLVQFENKEIEAALATLDQVVAKDPGYGAAYLDLAQLARTDGRPEIALTLLDKAAAIFSENPFIDMHRAEVLMAIGRTAEARALLEPLRNLPWSEHYHSGTSALLDRILRGDPRSSEEPSSIEGSP